MRSIIISVMTSFVMVITISGQSQWEIVKMGTGGTDAFDFINKDTGWIATERGIFRTNDGCENWISMFDGEKSFTKIDFINDSIGWAIEETLNDTTTTTYNILKTLNGGRAWFQKKNVANINDLLVISEDIVYAIGDSILTTVDGGSSWENISPYNGSEFSSGCFYNADTGIVIGNESIICRTFDRGKTWDTRTVPEFDYLLHIQFMNDSTCYFLGFDEWNNPKDAWNPLEKYFICKTTDLFSSWSVLYENDNPISWYHFYDNNVAISLVDSIEYPPSTYILKSTDSGSTWNSSELKPVHGLDWVYNLYATEQVTYVFAHAGRLNFLLKSIDQWNNWSLKRIAFPFNDAHFFTKDTGLVAGGISGFHHRWGMLLLTQDGGITWNFVYSPNSHPTDFHFINETKGFITTMNMNGYTSLMHTTSDGGKNWVTDYFLGRVLDISSFNDTLIWALAGSRYTQNKLYQTADGGETWNQFFNLAEEDCHRGNACRLKSIYFIDSNTGYGVGNDGLIIKFSLPESRENISFETSLPLNKVIFNNQKLGWIAGGYSNADGYSPIFLRTEDGGNNWTEIPDLDYLIKDFYFENNDHGWAAGMDSEERGVILETFDSGLHWEVVMDSLSGGLNALHFLDGYGWAVGDNGLILKYESTNVSNQKFSKISPESTIQNYPNPFQSRTVIRYNIPVTGDVELSIYDLSGRKVANLVKEKQQAGKQALEWNASGMEAGIYFCELRTGQGRQVIKMILID